MLVGLVAVLALAGSILTLLSAFSRQSVEGSLFLATLALTGLFAAGVGLWIAAHRPNQKEVLALAVGLVGLSFGGNLLRVAEAWEGTLLLAALGAAGANVAIALGTLGFLRFFSLFPHPITPSMEVPQLKRANTDRKRQQLQRDLERSIRVVRRIQGGGFWTLAGWAGACLGASAFAGVLLDVYGLQTLALLLAVGWGAPLAGAFVTQAFQESAGIETRRLLWVRWTVPEVETGHKMPTDVRRLLWVRWGITAALVTVLLAGALVLAGILFGFESTLLVRTLAVVLPLPPLCFLLGLMVAVFYGSPKPGVAEEG